MVPKKANKKKSRRYFECVSADAQKKPNPFDLKVNHKKYSYVGRSRKGEFGNPSVSRSKAIQRRKDKILWQIASKQKSNKFKDLRLGEKEILITPEDKSLLRLQAFKSEEASDLLPQTEYDFTINGDRLICPSHHDVEEDEDDELMNAFLSENPNNNGTISNIILQSKLEKEERMREKKEVDIATDKMNEDWQSMREYLKFRSEAANIRQCNKPDEYDSFVQSLKFSKRTQVLHDQRVTNFESKDEYEKRMIAESHARMQMPSAKKDYCSPDELFSDDQPQNVTKYVTKPNKSTSANQAKPVFLTELSHVPNDSIPFQQMPDTLEVFVLKISEDYISNMLRICNPLNNSGDREKLRILIDYTWNSFLRFSSSSEYTKLWILARTLQSLVYHYPDEIEPLFLAYLQDNSIFLKSHECLNSILRLIGLIYSVTDFKHKIGSIALRSGCILLRRLKLNSVYNCRNALTTCVVLTEYVELPGRHIPEILLTIHRVLNFMQFTDGNPCNHSVRSLDASIQQIDVPSDLCYCRIVLDALKLFKRQVQIVSKMPVNNLIIQQCIRYLESVTGFKKEINEIREFLEFVDKYRETSAGGIIVSHPLKMLKMKTPKLKSRYLKSAFETDFQRKMKMRKKLHKEVRCTAREIRREAQVISEIKLSKQRDIDKDRMEKVKSIMHHLANQEGDYRKFKKK
ncbi:hypothetical protein GJ496_004288 [Pomphorhynchus laevis]|nr:hypothetical protein GJ496_004288 [Pomphorhynchus laevis]